MSEVISDRLRKIPLLALGVIALLAVYIHPVAAAPGNLDTTFGTGGKVTTPIGTSNDDGYSVAVQCDGKIVVAEFSIVVGLTDFVVARGSRARAVDIVYCGSFRYAPEVKRILLHICCSRRDRLVIA